MLKVITVQLCQWFMLPSSGPSSIRTHTSQRVLNRASRFHRSAGIEDLDVRPSGRHSPVHLSSSPGSSPGWYHNCLHSTFMMGIEELEINV